MYDNTHSYNLEVVASWSRRGSSAPRAEIPPWQLPSGAQGRSVLAAWSWCKRMRGAGLPTPTMDTWVPDTCRESKQVLDAGDLGYPVWELFLSEVARPVGTGCPHGDMTPGCQRGCRCLDPGRGLGFPGWSHQRVERQFESFLIFPSQLRSGGVQSLAKTNLELWRCAPVPCVNAQPAKPQRVTNSYVPDLLTEVQVGRVNATYMLLIHHEFVSRKHSGRLNYWRWHAHPFIYFLKM